MKILFIDCNDQLAPVWERVLRADDPPIDVNRRPFEHRPICRDLLEGYDICIDDHSYMPTELVAQCDALKHIVFLGTGAVELHERRRAQRARRYRPHHQGLRRHRGRRARDCADARRGRDVAPMDRLIRSGTWSTREGVQLRGKTLGIIGLGGIGREVLRIGRGLGMEVIAWNRTGHEAATAGRARRTPGPLRRDQSASCAQRRDARLYRAGAACAHEAGRHSRQHRARRPDRRGGLARRPAQRPHPPCRPRRVPCRAAAETDHPLALWRTSR